MQDTSVPILKDIYKVLGKILNDLQSIINTVLDLPRIIKDSIETLLSSIGNAVKTSIELQIISRMSELTAVHKQVDVEEELLQEEIEEGKNRLSRLHRVYNDTQAITEEERNKRVTELLKPAFSLLDNDYESAINAHFVEIENASIEIDYITASVLFNRDKVLADKTNNVKTKINDFLENRKTAYDTIANFKLTANISKPIAVKIPFWIAKIEGEDLTDQVVIGPSNLNNNDNFFGLELISNESLDAVKKYVYENLDSFLNDSNNKIYHFDQDSFKTNSSNLEKKIPFTINKFQVVTNHIVEQLDKDVLEVSVNMDNANDLIMETLDPSDIDMPAKQKAIDSIDIDTTEISENVKVETMIRDAIYFFHKGKKEDAYKIFKEIEQITPNNPLVNGFLNDLESANSHKINSPDEDNIEMSEVPLEEEMFEQAIHEFDNGAPQEALKLFLELKELQPENPILDSFIAKCKTSMEE